MKGPERCKKRIFNLPYRRIVSCRASALLQARAFAGALSISNRRYGTARSSRNQITPQRRDEHREGTPAAHLCVRPVSAVSFLFQKSTQAATTLADTGRVQVRVTTTAGGPNGQAAVAALVTTRLISRLPRRIQPRSHERSYGERTENRFAFGQTCPYKRGTMIPGTQSAQPNAL